MPSTQDYEFVRRLSRRGREGGAQNRGLELFRDRRSKLFVVKKMLVDGEHRRQLEVEVLRHLAQYNHASISRYMGHGGESLFIEYCDLGALDSFIRRSIEERGACLPERFLWHTLQELTGALAFLHWGTDVPRRISRRDDWDYIIHRDLKPNNIFMTSGPGLYPRIILGDFGCSTTASERSRRDAAGTIAFRPPGELYTRSSDMWALGAVMLILMGARDQYNQPIRNPGARGYSPRLIRLANILRKSDPSARPRACDFLDTIGDQLRKGIQEGSIRRRCQSLPQEYFTAGERQPSR